MSRFTESQDEVIIDNETGLFWHKKDSRQLTGKWLHLEKARKFAEEQNKAGFGGYDDWRIPTLDEVKTIYGKEFSNRDFGNNEIFIPDTFEKGCADSTWTDTVNGERAMMFSLVKGRSSWINKFGEGPFAVRLVRGTPSTEES